MDNAKAIERANIALGESIERFVTAYAVAGAYMPSIATWLRIAADELADRFPDDTNGGRDE